MIHLKQYSVMGLMILLSHQVNAWELHTLLAQPVFGSMEEIAGADSITVISLEEFLVLYEIYLEEALMEEEQWAMEHLDFYDPLPEALRFQATGNVQDVRQRFIQAIRINPEAKLISYLQLLPGSEVGNRPLLNPGDVTPLKEHGGFYNVQFVGLNDQSRIDPLSVLVTANDEPDLALDIGLYENNNTSWGKQYGLGNQPFGSPTLEYGSQAPLHMGLYHEAGLIYAAAPFLKKCYPEYRIHLYKTLSELAFSLGEDYWGWRFMGWGLHYIADLTQPYHARALPGVGTTRMLFINVADMLGFSRMKDEAIQIVANRHTVMETLERQLLERVYLRQDWKNLHFQTLTADRMIPYYIDMLPRSVITKHAHAASRRLNNALKTSIPAKFVSDPQFDFANSSEKNDLLEIVESSRNPVALEDLELVLNDLLDQFATYGRSYAREILSKSS